MQNLLTIQVDTISAELMMLQLLRQDMEKIAEWSEDKSKKWVMFSSDEKEEKKQLKKLLKSYKTIIDYYNPENLL